MKKKKRKKKSSKKKAHRKIISKKIKSSEKGAHKKTRKSKKCLKKEKHIEKQILNKSGLSRKEKKLIKKFSEKIKKAKIEIREIITGQEEVLNGLLRAMICNGHVIVEGVPGVAKTSIVKALGVVSGCDVKRVQFTVDLLPTDIVGLTIYREKKGFEITKGPIFTNFLIADEINRAPPKTQSALLEAMQEKQVTIGRKTFQLQNPFLIMATQNPLEQAGVYTLPEAQVDRFIFKLLITYPTTDEEKIIMNKNIDIKGFNDFHLKKILSPGEIVHMQKIVKKIYLNKTIENYIVNLVNKTRDKKGKYGKYIEWGASPRATISLFIASKAEALINGRDYVVPQDVKKIAVDVLRHRIILNYEAEAENITPDSVINNILNEVPIR